ncbi:hypothetical protein DPX39_040045700 [Trypanosoma brucei equiperdum]|uniref:Uncharacterized protein n=1 Tax=Trypanosoma brucei equiperdum TaxID=630700 RepID=A0A3L6LCF4_9TRYP|nr:hypothetical protein DPX39_040045700 [Trypanosoma brucei equiperdum]
MPTPQQSEGKDLHRRFAEAAKGVTELYRNVTLSYNAGYRDALLLVERYALIAAQSGEATPHGALRRDDRTSDGGTDRNSHLSDQSISNDDSISISSSQDSAVPASRTSFAQWGTQSPQLLNIKQLLWFIQNIVKSHDALTGAPRTLKRRRRRSCSSAGARGCAVGNDNEDNTSSGEGGGSGGGFGGLPIPRFCSPQHRAENWNELLLLGEGRATPHTDADGINSEGEL